MYFSTKKLREARSGTKYVLLRHPLKVTGNVWIMGVKFCNGYGIVEKDSKVHKNIARSPIFKKHKSFGLEFLSKAGFRVKDVLVIWGKDIYYNYLDAVGLNADLTPKIGKITKEESNILKEVAEVIEDVVIETSDTEDSGVNEEEVPAMSLEDTIAAHKEIGLCIYLKADNTVCSNKVTKQSKTGNYCFGHIKKENKEE